MRHIMHKLLNSIDMYKSPTSRCTTAWSDTGSFIRCTCNCAESSRDQLYLFFLQRNCSP